MLSNSEWLLAAALIAIPFLLFGGVELAQASRRRRAKAIAQRRKGPLQR